MRAPDIPNYNIGIAVRLDGNLDIKLLKRSIQQVCSRHDALRSVLRCEGSESLPVQEVLAEVEAPFWVMDCSESHDPEVHAWQFMRKALQERFTLENDLLWKSVLVVVAEQRYYWLTCCHHVICDGTGLSIFFNDVCKFYTVAQRGAAADAQPAPSFTDYLAQDEAYLKSARAEKDRAYWQEKFSEHCTPIALGRGTHSANQVSTSGLVDWVIDSARFERLESWASSHGASTAHVFMALLAGYLTRISNTEELAIGMPVHNRSNARQKETIGMFASVIPVRLCVNAHQSFLELMEAVSVELRQSYRHQRLPIAEIKRSSHVLGHDGTPLFDVSLAFDRFSGDVMLGDIVPKGVRVHHGYEQLPLAICINNYRKGADVSVEFAFNEGYFEREEIARMVTHLDVMLTAVVDGGEDKKAIGELPLLTDQERNQVLKLFNATQADYPREALIHELFEQQVEKTPDAVAVVYEDKSLTYTQLNARANQLARRLRALGVQPDTRVAICVERSLEMVVGLLGILKAGGAYVPVDPEYPQDRIAYILRDAGAPVLLTQGRLEERLGFALSAYAGIAEDTAADALTTQTVPVVVHLDRDETYAGQPSSNISARETGQTSRHLAYVIYTSGSTGLPKGVEICHQNVDRLLKATDEWFAFGGRDVWTMFHSYAFDFSVWEVFGALCTGGRLVVVPYLVSRSPDDFLQLLRREHVTVLNQTPSAFGQLMGASGVYDEALSLRLVIFGGEALNPGNLASWIEHRGDQNPRLVNMYGITETTVHVTYRPIQASDLNRDRSPMGRPIPDLGLRVLDAWMNPVPIGVAGELYVAGAGLARGYLNRPELTAERFIKDPFDESKRLYRTGDLVRVTAEGELEYLGRVDHQVKIRGLRIELGEIEARLAELPEVREAIVIAREDQPGGKRLVAYWTTAGGMAEAEVPTLEQLRDHLRAGLPAYMVPAAFVRLDAMPLTPNGKVDRKALPAPDQSALRTQEYEAPQGATEETLAAIWQELLGVEKVGRHDNFFDLGGHSLLIVSLVERLRQHGLKTEIRQVFAAQSLAALAGELQTQKADEVWQAPLNLIPEGCERITPEMLPLVDLTQEEIDRIVAKVPGGAANVQDIYPLAPLQEGVLFHHRFEQGSDPYLLWAIMAFDSAQAFNAFTEAMNAVIARHDVLRTAVLWQELPQAVQVVYREARLRTEPLVLEGQGDVEDRLRAWLQEAPLSMDLGQAPLLSLSPVQAAEGDGRCFAVLLMHHIVDDNTSLRVMLDEVSAVLSGRTESLPAPMAYRDFVAHSLAKAEQHDAETYFREVLGDVTEPTAPFGLLDVHGDGLGIEEASRPVEEGLAARLRTAVQRLGMSPATLFHVAWALVVGQTSSRDDVVFGSVMSGRMGGVAGVDRMMGMFINTLPVRLQLKDRSVLDAMRAMHKSLVDLLKYEQTPLAEVQRCSGISGGVALFSAMLNYRHSKPVEHTAAFEGVEVIGGQERTNYPFGVSMDDLGEGFALTVQTQVDTVKPQRVVDYLHRAVEQVVQALEAAPQTAVLKLSVLPEVEREQVLKLFNDTQADYPKEALIHELFEQQVQKTPDAVAVVYEDESLTYAQLNAKANQLAHRLRALRDKSGHPMVGPDTRVAICVERSVEMVVGLLGILKSGGAYVPVDPEYPEDRIAYILRDAGASILLTQGRLEEKLGLTLSAAAGNAEGTAVDGAKAAQTSPVVLHLDRDEVYAGQPSANLSARETGQTSAHLAYVIYTSGSTGNPKGVMYAHQGVVNRLVSMQQEYQLTEHDRVLQKTAFSFDVSVWEFFWPLMVGARLVEARPQGHQEMRYLRDLISRQGITTVHFVPSMLQVFLEELEEDPLVSVRQLMCSGEELPLSLQRRCLEKLPAIRLHNQYGPTETGEISFWEGDPTQQDGSIPIGKPISNTRIYILDGQGQPVPIGVTGEIHIAGDGVARGYLNRPELTAEKFIRDPFSTQEGARMYRTGDLGRWRSDGAIEYLGRNDFQVKIRGLRIELGEIEARIAELEDIREAIVLAREDQLGDKRLVAYVTLHGAEAEASHLDVEALREHLKASLPGYMVPAAFVRLDVMPLTPNGKVDRKALPAPDQSALRTQEYEAPQGATEETLAAIWQELLGVDRVGRHDNFFDLGGHSLLAVQLLARIRQDLRQEVALKTLFEAANVAEIAGKLQASDVVLLAPIEHANRAGELKLSWSQQRLWFLEQLEDLGNAYHIEGALRLEGELDEAALKAALDAIVARHEALRTVFVRSDDEAEPHQVVQAAAGFVLACKDLSMLSEQEREGELQAELARAAAQRFDLSQGPLIRGELIRLSDEEHVLFMSMHHIVSDGWSMGVLTQELSALYAAKRRGEQDLVSVLPALPIQYVDYAQWQRQWLTGERLGEQLSFWKERLTGAPSLLELPTDHPRPAVKGYAGAAIEFELSPILSQGLHALGRRHGATLFMVLQAAWAVLLGRLSGQDDIVIGTPVANRRRSELEGLIGFFVNTLALRTRIEPQQTVSELLGQIKQSTLEAFNHQDAPFEQVVEAVRPERSLSHSPLFQVMLVLQNTPQTAFELPGLKLSMQGQERHAAQFDLSLSLQEGEDGRLNGALEYSTALFERETVERWQGHLKVLLGAMVADEQQQLKRLPLLSEQEQNQVLKLFNDTQADYPKEALIHELFEQQVQKTPDAVAVVYENEQLTYAQLNAKANQLAHWLRARGVNAGDCVAVIARRGLGSIISELATLKAGAAYVPIDPEFPSERQHFMVSDSGASAVIIERSADRLVQSSVPVVDLESEAESFANYPIENPALKERQAPAQAVAYVMYTSGSTGTPKGVVVPHAAVNRLVINNGYAEILPEDVIAHCSNPAFDASTFEIWGALLNGARVVIVPHEQVMDPAQFREVLLEHEVSILWLTAGLFNQYADALKDVFGRLKYLLAGGDVLDPATVRNVLKNSPPQNLLNGYGPTETTTFATTCRLNGKVDEETWSIPIGRPIANTRIYILDEQGEPVPIGVAGEIHIAGDGVARGYLNRPELTAERFIRDPFSGEANARMYKTGDLGKWRANGAIEYLGRNDFQVKIRGLRIELGEIEARIAELEDIREAIVLAREDQPGDKRLVAYVTLHGAEAEASHLDVEALREHLKASLPGYMVPAAFVKLDVMPLTPNGKVDRKVLPAPDQSALQTQAYEAPVGETEQVLAAIWQELLGVEKVGRHDNFFDLGGHSLLITQAVVRIEQALGVKLSLRVLFEHTTMSDLAAVIEAASRQGSDEIGHEESVLDLEKEVLLDSSIQLPSAASDSATLPVMTASDARAIFLTGATGFLGAYLLHELLRSTSAAVYCLVRAKTPSQGMDRLKNNLQQYGLWDAQLHDRIVVVCGDMEKPMLGLVPAVFDELAQCIDLIIHNGAWVNFIYPYETLKAANVQGTQEVIRLAAQTKVKPLHFVSTASVFPATTEPYRRVYESDEPEQWQGLADGYPQSKWVAEKLVYLAGRQGLPVSIHRPGSIWGDVHSGACNTSDLVFRMIKGCIELGMAPDLGASIALVPVDYVSRAIVHLASLPLQGTHAFNLINPHGGVSYRGLFELIKEQGYRVEITSPQQWQKALLKEVQKSEQHVLYPFLSMFPADAEVSDEERQEGTEHGSHHDPLLDCQDTLRKLQGSGIACPEVNAALLKVYLDYFERSGFLNTVK